MQMDGTQNVSFSQAPQGILTRRLVFERETASQLPSLIVSHLLFCVLEPSGYLDMSVSLISLSSFLEGNYLINLYITSIYCLLLA